MAPETVTAPETVDARADLYALGAVGYWLLTGSHVFDGRSVVAVLGQHVHAIPDSPSTRLGAPVSPDLETLILECLAKRPADRPASAHVLRARLRACVASGGWTSDRAAEWWAVHRQKLQAGADNTRRTRGRANAALPHLTVTRVAE
jgi:serine/threonine protein kinase